MFTAYLCINKECDKFFLTKTGLELKCRKIFEKYSDNFSSKMTNTLEQLVINLLIAFKSKSNCRVVFPKGKCHIKHERQN